MFHISVEALEESWFGEALLRLLLACSFIAGLIGQPAWSMRRWAALSGPCTVGCLCWFE